MAKKKKKIDPKYPEEVLVDVFALEEAVCMTTPDQLDNI